MGCQLTRVFDPSSRLYPCSYADLRPLRFARLQPRSLQPRKPVPVSRHKKTARGVCLGRSSRTRVLTALDGILQQTGKAIAHRGAFIAPERNRPAAAWEFPAQAVWTNRYLL